MTERKNSRGQGGGGGRGRGQKRPDDRFGECCSPGHIILPGKGIMGVLVTDRIQLKASS